MKFFFFTIYFPINQWLFTWKTMTFDKLIYLINDLNRNWCMWVMFNTFHPELYFLPTPAVSPFLAIKKKMMGTLTFYLIYARIYFLSWKCRELWQEALMYHFPWWLINYSWMKSSEGLGESSKSGSTTTSRVESVKKSNLISNILRYCCPWSS